VVAGSGSDAEQFSKFRKSRNEFSIAEEKYQETLVIYRKLAEKNPQTWLADVAGTLNNLAVLQKGIRRH
jgi:hypothetical protein